jgi:hypothetical protein
MNSDKAKRLSQLIDDSSVLSEPEKTEWLNLLTLMNDKQMADLEEILTSKSRGGAVPPVMPNLSHITNLPPGVARNVPVSEPPPVSNTTSDLASHLRKIQTTPLPDIKPQIRVEKGPAATQGTWRPTPEASQSAPVPPPGTKAAVFDSLESVQALSAPLLRATGFESTKKQLSELVAQYSYFYVLSALEQSALYHSYIQAGATMLRGGIVEPSQTMLTKEEFERVADLLHNLQFS